MIMRKLVRLTVSADLSDCAIEEAQRLLQKNGDAGKTLIATSADGVIAGQLAKKNGFQIILLPMFPRDAWALCGEDTDVWSAGP